MGTSMEMRVFIILLLCATPAMAQQKESTAIERISGALGQCIGALEGRNDQVFDLQKKLDLALAELRVLKEKSDAK